MKLIMEPLADNTLSETLEFMKATSATGESVWGWDAGRFVDWYWGFAFVE